MGHLPAILTVLIYEIHHESAHRIGGGAKLECDMEVLYFTLLLGTCLDEDI